MNNKMYLLNIDFFIIISFLLTFKVFSQDIETMAPQDAFNIYMKNPIHKMYNLKCLYLGSYHPFHYINNGFLYLLRLIEKTENIWSISLHRVSYKGYENNFINIDLDERYMPYQYFVNYNIGVVFVSNFKGMYYYYLFDCNNPTQINKGQLDFKSSFQRVIYGPSPDGKIWIYSEEESRFATPKVENIHSQLIEYDLVKNCIIQSRKIMNYPQYDILSGNPDVFLIGYDLKLNRFMLKTFSIDIYLDSFDPTIIRNVYIIKFYNSNYNSIVFSDSNKQFSIIPQEAFMKILENDTSRKLIFSIMRGMTE